MFCCREFITEWDCSGIGILLMYFGIRRAMLEVVNYDIV